jgi:hypothetical protein
MELTELQEAWLQTLESGEYKQGYSMLRTEYNDNQLFCCMGVMCDLGVKRGIIFSYDPHEGYPPDKIVAAFRLIDSHSENSPFDESQGTIELSALNDGEELDFVQIAAEVRQHPELYFISQD